MDGNMCGRTETNDTNLTDLDKEKAVVDHIIRAAKNCLQLLASASNIQEELDLFIYVMRKLLVPSAS